MALNARDKKLAELLATNMPEYKAYVEAGFSAKTAGSHASRSIDKKMRNNAEFKKYYDSLVQPALEAEERESMKRRMTADDINAFWESIINDPDARPKDKLRASENRAKALGMFIEKQQVEMTGAVPVIMKDDVCE